MRYGEDMNREAYAKELLIWFYTAYAEDPFQEVSEMMPPAGWRFVGAGAFRTTYLNEETREVYKIQTIPDSVCANVQEYKTAQRFRDEPWAVSCELVYVYWEGTLVSEYGDTFEDVNIPVAVMPYVASDGSELSQEGMDWLARECPINDVRHYGDSLRPHHNYAVINGMPVVFDYGLGSSEDENG